MWVLIEVLVFLKTVFDCLRKKLEIVALRFLFVVHMKHCFTILPYIAFQY